MLKLDEAIAQNKDYFLVVDNNKDIILENISKILNVQTSFGEVAYIPSEIQNLQLTINGEDKNYLESENENNVDVKIIVASGLTSQIEYVAGFNKQGTDKNKNIVAKKVKS